MRARATLLLAGALAASGAVRAGAAELGPPLPVARGTAPELVLTGSGSGFLLSTGGDGRPRLTELDFGGRSARTRILAGLRAIVPVESGRIAGLLMGESGLRAGVARDGRGRLGRVRTLSRSREVGSPVLAANGRGDTVVAWSVGRRVFAATRRRGGRFGAARRVARAARSAVEVAATVSPRGLVSVAWADGRVALRSGRVGRPLARRVRRLPGSASGVQLASGAGHRLDMLTSRAAGAAPVPGGPRVRSLRLRRLRDDARSVGRSLALSADAFAPLLLAGPQGQATVTWKQSQAPAPTGTVVTLDARNRRTTRRLPGGVELLDTAVGEDGTVASVVVDAESASAPHLLVAPPSGPFGPPEPLAPFGPARLDLAVDFVPGSRRLVVVVPQATDATGRDLAIRTRLP